MRHKTLLCNCNRTMTVDAKAIAGTLGGDELPPVRSELCRHHLASFEAAGRSGDDLLVACTQEAPLFSALHEEMGGQGSIRFVNVRETAGWSEEGAQAAPKMAALLAAADLPDPEPVATVNYEAGNELLIVGPGAAALPWAERLAGQFSVTVLMSDDGRGAELAGEHRYPVFSGKVSALSGYLGAFTASWKQRNPIDLEACTRCGACIEACPEQAIDFSFQINLEKCKSHRKCVAACGTVQAIDFDRSDSPREDRFDLVLDLDDRPHIRTEQPPQGYFAPGRDPLEQALAVAGLAQMTGVFEKPKFFSYRENICAHARSGITGCTQCIDVCSTGAISSLLKENKVVVEPHLCMGCGGCTTVCPSGAMSYAWPRVADFGVRLKAALKAYRAAGGHNPRLLFHAGGSRELLAMLARRGKGLPADLIPLEVQHVAAVGLDLMLGAIALGAAQVVVLGTGTESAGYVEAGVREAELAQELLAGFGHGGERVLWLTAADAAEAQARLWGLSRPQSLPVAGFNLGNDKRATLDFVFDHLLSHAPRKVEAAIALKAGAPYGSVEVDKEKCTLCMACVGACPEGALLDAKESPALRFIEKNCVQCGLCVRTCPEQALALLPRLLSGAPAKTVRTLNEAQAFNCIKCGKPFGTRQMVDGMLSRLGSHPMFAEAGALDRIKMCADCRVVDLLQNSRHGNIKDF